MNKIELSKQSYNTSIEKGFKFDNINSLLVDALGELYEGLSVEMITGNVCIDLEDIKTYLGAKSLAVLNDTREMEIADCYNRILSILGSKCHNFEPSALVTGVSSQIRKANKYTDFMQAVGERLLGSSGYEPVLHGVLDGIEEWCKRQEINLEFFVTAKLEYNKTRPYLHKAI